MNTHCPGCGGPESVKNRVVVADGRWWCSIHCHIRTKRRKKS